jgi:hypothetical protein
VVDDGTEDSPPDLTTDVSGGTSLGADYLLADVIPDVLRGVGRP